MSMKSLTCLFLLISFTCSLIAQDIIIAHSGEISEGKVMEITPSMIKYKKKENLDGPLYSMGKSDVFMVRFENGSKVLMKEESFTSESTQVKDEPVQTEPFPTATEVQPRMVNSSPSYPNPTQTAYESTAIRTTPTYSGPQNGVYQTPDYYLPATGSNFLAAPANMARLVIYRPKSWVGSVRAFWIRANGTKIAKPKNGSYTIVDLPPGQTRFFTQGIKNTTRSTILEPGQTYFMRCGIKSNVIDFYLDLAFVTSEQGQSEISSLKQK